MIASLKQKLINTIGFSRYRWLLVRGMRIVSAYRIRQWLNEAVTPLQSISDKGSDCWFGYYDVPATSPDGTKQLFIKVVDGSHVAEVCTMDIPSGQKRVLTETRAWCWQMGCRSQWLDNNRILFNDFDGDEYVARIVDLEGNECHRFSFPVYALSRDRSIAFFPDFEILESLRPGYGYSCKGSTGKAYYQTSQNGVWRGDFSTGETRCLITMERLLSTSFSEGSLEGSHYINHISASSYADVLMFFHLWTSPNEEVRNRVVIMRFDGSVLRVLDDFDRASHYAWRDSSHLLLTVYSRGGCEYRLYDLNTGRYEEFKFLREDGHPSYVGKGLFITDTYPDHLGMQHLILCSEHAVLAEIATVFHNPAKVDEYRCDFHPRYASGLLSFDSLSGAFREQKLIKVQFDADDISALEEGDNSNRGFVGIYRRLAATREALPIKVLYNRITNVAMKAHWDLEKMLNAKHKLKKRHYHNKLQAKYGIWISPECRIGKRFRMMHLQGITIGSGVVVGNDCTLYQQVTLGKEKGQFPIIGNGVMVCDSAKVIGGIKVGDNAVIGANAVVTKDVLANAIVAGIPAKIIRMRDDAGDSDSQ